MDDALAILAEELGLSIEQLIAEIETSCEAIEAEESPAGRGDQVSSRQLTAVN